jgi:RNA polymerase sigma-70 factor (ECF subfamily)
LTKPEFPSAGSPFSRSLQPPSLAKFKGLNDGELMAQLQAGCSDALAVLFDRYHRLVLSIALKIVRDPGEAEDVMQSVFLEIFRSVAQFDPAKGTTKVWMLREGLATLNGPQKQVVELASFNGLTMREIADKMGDSLSNVRHHYYRGLQKLRSFVEGTPEKGKAAGGHE